MPRSATAIVRIANARVLAGGELDRIPEFFTMDYVAHVTGQDLRLGYAGVRRIVALYRRAFPDLEVEVRILVASGKRVAWQRTLRGTHRGAFRGFPPTGRRVTWQEQSMSRFRGGRIAEDWLVSDLAAQLLRSRKGR